MGKGREAAHHQVAPAADRLPEIQPDYCFLLQDPKGRFMQGDQAWATTLVAFDTTSGNSIGLAVPTKTDENRTSARR